MVLPLVLRHHLLYNAHNTTEGMQMNRESRLPEKVQVARMALMREYPYLSAGLMAFIPINEPKCPTMGVDMFGRLYFNEEEVNKWTEDQIKTVLWHELQHLLSEHHDRARTMNAYDAPWNVAADAEINDDLRKMGFDFPKFHNDKGDEVGGCVFPETIIHKDTGKPMDEWLMAEDYYEGLDIQVVNCSCPDPSQQGSTSQTSDQSDQSQNSNGSSDQNQSSGGSASSEATDQSGQGEGNPTPGGSGHGHGDGTDPNCPIHGQNPIPHSSGSGMQPASWEEQESQAGEEGTRKLDKAESEIIRRNTAKAVQDHVQKSRGDVPAFMERWANMKLKPKVPWKKVLRGAIRKTVAEVSGAVDYTRSRPARRQSAFGKVIMPSLRQPIPKVAFGLDTSGSMSEKELSMGVTEVESVLKSLGVRDLVFFAVDAQVGFVNKITSAKNIKLIGGGGTDMGVAVEQAKTLKPRPDFLVIFTDGYTPWPAQGPDFKVIVVCTTEDVEGPEWAKTIHVNMEDL